MFTFPLLPLCTLVCIVVCILSFVWTIGNRGWQVVCVYVEDRVEGSRCFRRPIGSFRHICSPGQDVSEFLIFLERIEATDHWQYC